MKFTRSKESCSRGGLYKQKNFFGANLFVSILCQDTGGKFLLAKTGMFAESKMPQNWWKTVIFTQNHILELWGQSVSVTFFGF